MIKGKIILLVVGVGLVVLLFNLPKYVVSNTSKEEGIVEVPHSTISVQELEAIASLKSKLSAEKDTQIQKQLLDSLVFIFNNKEKFDSAAFFGEKLASLYPSTESFQKVAENYYEAFTYTVDERKREQYGAKAREYYQKVLSIDSTKLNLKVRQAITLVEGASPMEGIALLKDVLEKDPENKEALFHLGRFALIAKPENAITYLEKLVKIDSTYIQANVLLGVAYVRNGLKEKAVDQFDKIKRSTDDPEILSLIEEQLKEL